jgi:hypothetical protein
MAYKSESGSASANYNIKVFQNSLEKLFCEGKSSVHTTCKTINLKINDMKNIIVSLCLLIAVVLFSCQKEEPITAPVNSEVMILNSLLMDGEPYYQYSYKDSTTVADESSKLDYVVHHYNSKNLVVSSDYYWNTTLLTTEINTIETTLSQSAMVTAANGTKAATITYEYDGNDQLSKATWSRPATGNSEYSAFSYDGNGRINKQSLYWKSVETGYIDYFYDSRGNLSKENLYDISADGASELSTTTQYAYDNQQNPYYLFRTLLIPGINTNRNNIIKETYTVHKTSDQDAGKVQVTTNSYEYNSNGYPVSKNGNIKYIYD